MYCTQLHALAVMFSPYRLWIDIGMLVAQAQIDGMILVTADTRIQVYPEVSCLAWK